MSPAKIVVIGSFNADLTTYMKRMPKPGETVSGDRFVIGPGGKGSNQAVAAARLGADVTFVGRIGDDLFGDMALDFWKQEDINTEFVIKDRNHATGVAPIFVDETAQNSIVVALGANLNIQPSDIEAAEKKIADADVVIVQLEINYSMVTFALEIAKKNGVKTILNPAPAGKLMEKTIKLADFITPNETELEVLSGKEVHGMANFKEIARSLLNRDDQTVIITLGSNGAMFVHNKNSGIIAGHEVDAVDTTGAGDSFNGSFAVAIGEKKGLEESLNFANAAAALCVTKYGTAPSMPYRVDVEKFLRQPN